jgi:Flp pilus assembly protein TadB
VRNSDVEIHRITSAQPGPSADLMSRERTYLFLMATRMVAIVVAVVVPGVWRWVAIALGVLLPYIAVVLVNTAKTRGTEDDPNFFVPDHKVALADRPFEGTVIPHDEAPTG